MLVFYRVLQIFLLPLVALLFVIRLKKGKEHTTRWREKWSFTAHQRPQGKLIHIHAASVGEANSLLPLLEKLNLSTHVLLTTGTVTSARLMEKKLPTIQEKTKSSYQLIHQFAPLDFYPIVRRFYTHWQPEMTLFAESEFWPELMTQAPRSILVNARISDRSWPKYQKLSFFFKPLIRSFEAIFTQQKRDAERLKVLGGKNVEVAGNLKFDAAPLDVDKDALTALKKDIGKRPVIVFASTHQGEEEQALALHQSVQKTHENLLTIIVPRHPSRGDVIAELLKDKASIAQRSQGNRPTESTEIYIADTLGELGLFYRLADVAIIGGSLVLHGGQNPLEALRFGTQTLSGPHMFNFTDMLPLLSDVFNPAPTLEELTNQAINALSQNQETERQKRLSVMGKLTGPTDHIAAYILKEGEK